MYSLNRGKKRFNRYFFRLDGLFRFHGWKFLQLRQTHKIGFAVILYQSLIPSKTLPIHGILNITRLGQNYHVVENNRRIHFRQTIKNIPRAVIYHNKASPWPVTVIADFRHAIRYFTVHIY